MNKLLREVPTIESWISDASSEFVQVSLHQDFIKSALQKLRASVDTWLLEPQEFCDAIIKRCKSFIIDVHMFSVCLNPYLPCLSQFCTLPFLC